MILSVSDVFGFYEVQSSHVKQISPDTPSFARAMWLRLWTDRHNKNEAFCSLTCSTHFMKNKKKKHNKFD